MNLERLAPLTIPNYSFGGGVILATEWTLIGGLYSYIVKCDPKIGALVFGVTSVVHLIFNNMAVNTQTTNPRMAWKILLISDLCISLVAIGALQALKQIAIPGVIGLLICTSLVTVIHYEGLRRVSL